MILLLSSDGKRLHTRRNGAWSQIRVRVLIASCWLLALLAVPFVALWLVIGGI